MTSQDPGPKGPGQFRMILRYKPQASSTKRQASSMEELDPTIDWNKLIDTLKTK